MTAKSKAPPVRAKAKKGMGQFVASKPAAAPTKRKASAATSTPIAADKAPEKRQPGLTAADYAADEAEMRRSIGRSSRRIFDERKPLITRLSPEQHKRLRTIALELDMTVQDIVMSGLSLFLEQRGLDPLT